MKSIKMTLALFVVLGAGAIAMAGCDDDYVSYRRHYRVRPYRNFAHGGWYEEDYRVYRTPRRHHRGWRFCGHCDRRHAPGRCHRRYGGHHKRRDWDEDDWEDYYEELEERREEYYEDLYDD